MACGSGGGSGGDGGRATRERRGGEGEAAMEEIYGELVERT